MEAKYNHLRRLRLVGQGRSVLEDIAVVVAVEAVPGHEEAEWAVVWDKDLLSLTDEVRSTVRNKKMSFLEGPFVLIMRAKA